MSTFKNAKKSLQKTHRERSQPGARKHFGLLEKHKDYVLRAKDYHRKEARLKLLREKARDKNPDEFYFKMVNTKIQDGVHVVENKKEYTADQLKIMKSQDLNYTKMKKTMERKKVEKLKTSLHLLGELEDSPPNTHTVFVASKKEVKTFDAATHFKTHPELVNRRFNRLRVDQLQGKPLSNAVSRERLRKGRRGAYDELAKRIEREKHLSSVEEQMQLQKHLMGKGRRMKIQTEEDGPVTYKWKKQRKKWTNGIRINHLTHYQLNTLAAWKKLMFQVWVFLMGQVDVFVWLFQSIHAWEIIENCCLVQDL